MGDTAAIAVWTHVNTTFKLNVLQSMSPKHVIKILTMIKSYLYKVVFLWVTPFCGAIGMGHVFSHGKMTFNPPQSSESSYGLAYKFAAYFLIQLILKKLS